MLSLLIGRKSGKVKTSNWIIKEHTSNVASLLLATAIMPSIPIPNSDKLSKAFCPHPRTWLSIYPLSNFPIWLLALEAILVTKVCIVGFLTHEELLKLQKVLGSDLTVLEAAQDNVVRNTIFYRGETSSSKDAVLLVSGSIGYVKTWVS
jgi:hypothetical protein